MLEAKDIISGIATILKEYITDGNNTLPHNRATLLFNESKYLNKTWNIILFSGFHSTLPTFKYHSLRQKYQAVVPEKKDIEGFIELIYEKVKPPLECVIVGFIYIEKLMVLLYCIT